MRAVVKRMPSICFGLTGLLCLSAVLVAQNSRGTILGHIADPSGAVVVGAKVTVRNTNTGVTNQFATNSSGDYVFVNLIPGTYTITVDAAGFKGEQTSGLTLEVDQTLRQDYRLNVGAATEKVEVNSDTQMVQTDNTTVGNVIEQKLVEDLPSTGRDITNLLELTAGAGNISGGSQVAFAGHGLNNNFAEVSLNGSRPESTSFVLDGVTDTDSFFGGIANIPSEFSVQEVKIQTGLYSAEYGQGSGQVNIAVKSGTNAWHGQAYEFFQNDALNPSSPLQKQLNQINGTDLPLKLPFKQNQFGGTLGGPVRIPYVYDGHDKTFWFFSYDGGRRSQSTGTTQAVMIPSAIERSGDFSDWPFPIYDPLTTGAVAPTPSNPSGRLPFPGNKIPTQRLDAMGQKLVNLYPAPNVASCSNFLSNPGRPCQNYSIPIHQSTNTNNITMRVDQNWGSKDRLYFTGNIRREDSPNPSELPFSGSTSFTHGELFGLNWEHSFSTNMINTARFGYNHQFFNSSPETAYGPNLQQQLGFQNTTALPALFGIPVINLADGYKQIGNGNFGISNKHSSFQFVENLKWIHGKHTFTFGADIRRLREFEQDNYLGIGSLTFNGGYTASDPTAAGTNPGPTAGNGVADLLLGNTNTLSPPAPLGVDYLHVYGTNWNFFAQDDIRVTPRLTVNLGLRYEIPPNYHTSDGSGWNFDPANGGSLSWVSQSFVNNVKQTATAEGLTPYEPYLNCCVPNTLVPIDKKNFAPRIGIAWRPLQTDRFVIRAGYGIFYDTYMRYYDLIQNFDSNALQTEFANNTYTAGTGGEKVSPEPPLGQLWLPPISSAQFFSTTQPWNSPGFSSPILNQVAWPYNHNPYNQQWTVDTQYALRSELLLDIGYVGQHGLREPTYLLFNTATPPKVAGDPCNYLFDVSQATGSNASCVGDTNFQPIDTRVPYGNLPSIMYANANILGSNYNALQVQLRQRFTHGLTYLVSYTWSRAFDELSGVGNISGNNGFTQDPHNVAADYGPASFDQPNRLTASGSWELPVGKNKRFSLGAANWILGDWQISGIYTLTSGRTFSVYGYSGPGFDQMGVPFTGRYRADVSGNAKSGFQQTPAEWFNTSLFSTAAPGTYGDSPKGFLRGPYFEDLDLGFTKVFPITERQKLQFRTEIFNVGSNWHAKNDFSGSNLIPGNTFGSCNFGTLGGYGCDGASTGAHLWYPHTLQLSLVYSF